jgi:hypothetical protein
MDLSTTAFPSNSAKVYLGGIIRKQPLPDIQDYVRKKQELCRGVHPSPFAGLLQICNEGTSRPDDKAADGMPTTITLGRSFPTIDDSVATCQPNGSSSNSSAGEDVPIAHLRRTRPISPFLLVYSRYHHILESASQSLLLTDIACNCVVVWPKKKRIQILFSQ